MQPLRPLAGGAALAAVLGMLACGCGRSEGDDSSTPATVASPPYSLTLLGRTPEEDRTVLVIHGVEEFGAENLRLQLRNGEWRPPLAESFTSADAERRLLISQREPAPPDVLIEARTVDGTDLWLPCYEAVLPSLPPGAEPTQLDLRDLLRRAEWRFSTPWPDEEHRFEVTLQTRRPDQRPTSSHSAWNSVPKSVWNASMSLPKDGHLRVTVALGEDSLGRDYDLDRRPQTCEFLMPSGEVWVERPVIEAGAPEFGSWQVTFLGRAGPGSWVRTIQRTLGPEEWTRVRLVPPAEYLLEISPTGVPGDGIAWTRFEHHAQSRVRFTLPTHPPREFSFEPPPADAEPLAMRAAFFSDLAPDVMLALREFEYRLGEPIRIQVPERADLVRLTVGSYVCTAIRTAARDGFELLDPWRRPRPYLLGARTDATFLPDWITVLDEKGGLVQGGPLVRTGLGGLVLKVGLDPGRRYRFVAYERTVFREVLADAGAEPWIALEFTR